MNLFLDNRTDLRYLQQLLGHFSTKSTEIYPYKTLKENKKLYALP